MSADLRDPVPTHPPEGDRDPLYCEKCDSPVRSVDAYGWCESCVDAYDPTPDSISDDGPLTIAEQCEAAWRIKKGLR